jgi:glutathione synthase/RimK-type ligase-like ATP-grasp enzyme
MILVCGGLADTITELMCARLDDCGYKYRFIDLATYPKGFQIKWHWQDGYPSGYIAGPGWKLDLEEITGVFVRYPGQEARIAPEGIIEDALPAMYFEYDTGLMTLFDSLPCLVINRTAGGLSNGSKPYQALLVRKCGLLTPPTLVTTDPGAVSRFYNECNGEVIYKSLSGIRSIVSRLKPQQMNRLPLLRHGPVQFQKFIPGENVRVHVVKDRVFATRIISEAVDYRYSGREGCKVEMEPAILPPAIESSCIELASKLDLLLAGIDLKLTPAGEYYCFEINPSPAFLYYEKNSSQPISTAVAELLHEGSAGLRQPERMLTMNYL